MCGGAPSSSHRPTDDHPSKSRNFFSTDTQFSTVYRKVPGRRRRRRRRRRREEEEEVRRR
jgi:hypothetical protein